MSHKFTLTRKDSESKVTVKVSEHAAIPELLETFEDYIRASGYVLDGKLEIVKDDK